MIGMLHAAEVIRAPARRPCSADNPPRQKPREREDVGIIETRGHPDPPLPWGDGRPGELLQPHRLPTHNNQAANEAVRQVAAATSTVASSPKACSTEPIVAIRAFDPCLSCATHALGKMPLAVELVGADGSLVDSATSGG